MIRKLTDIGVTSKLSSGDRARVQLVNVISQVTLALYLFYVAYGLFIKNPFTSWLAASLFLATLAILFLNKIRYHRLAKSMLFAVNSLVIWVAYQIFNIDFSILVFFFPILFCYTFFFKLPEENDYFVPTAFLTFLTIGSSLFLPKYIFYQVELSPEIVDLSNRLHLSLSFLLTFLILVITFKHKKVIYEQLIAERIRAIKAVHELEWTQAKLIQSEKMASLGLLVSGINHEINNPLNFIQVGLEALKSNMSEKMMEKSKVSLRALNEGINRIKGIVSSLNYFNHQSNEQDGSCNIHIIIDNCLKIMMFEIKKGIQVTKDYSNKPIVILGNSGELHQVFLNLLTNAIHAAKNHGSIWIETIQTQAAIEIIITDNGYGIPEHLQSRIFEPFFTTKEPGVGTGLGLPISYKIIEDHHGSINIKSKVGEGTKVMVQFPTH